MVRDGDRTEDEHRRIAAEMYERWRAGEPKSQLEIEYWDNPTSHGKAFTTYVKKWTGHSTERRSGQTERIERLEALLRVHGVSPTDAGDLAEEYRLLAKSRESALAAVRVYNDPLAGFRTETFILLMVIAWNAVLQAVCERDGLDYYQRNEHGHQIKIGRRAKVKDTWELVGLVLADPSYQALGANLDFFLRLRHQIAHRYIPALDTAVVGEAQAMLLNFENVLAAKFGEEAVLGEKLAVPLQLSGFRSEEAMRSLKKAQAQLPTDVADFLARHREELPDEVLASRDYCLQVFFVPVAANRERSADAVVRFVAPDQVTPELADELQRLGVVTKLRRTPVASDDLLRPKEVVNLVAERLPHRFTMDTHTRCWKHFRVRHTKGAGEPEATNGDFCRWDRLLGGYGYTQAWVEKLVKDLSDPDTYQAVVGYPPDQR